MPPTIRIDLPPAVPGRPEAEPAGLADDLAEELGIYPVITTAPRSVDWTAVATVLSTTVNVFLAGMVSRYGTDAARRLGRVFDRLRTAAPTATRMVLLNEPNGLSIVFDWGTIDGMAVRALFTEDLEAYRDGGVLQWDRDAERWVISGKRPAEPGADVVTESNRSREVQPTGMWTPQAVEAAESGGRPHGQVQYNTATGGGTVFGVQGGNIIIHPGATPQSSPAAGPAPAPDRIRILMLAANPASTGRLALDEEAREIGQKLRLARDRDVFELITRWAVRPADLLQHLNEFRPQIVHFSGHGDHAGEIVLSAGDGAHRRVEPAALAELFRVMRGDIRVVVLNACYSAVQARAIGAHIDYIIGMRTRVDDGAATVFASAFYSALGFGRSVIEAFEQAVASIMVHGLPGHDIPQLLVRTGANPHLTLTP